jgi:hypothetical protein
MTIQYNILIKITIYFSQNKKISIKSIGTCIYITSSFFIDPAGMYLNYFARDQKSDIIFNFRLFYKSMILMVYHYNSVLIIYLINPL